MVVFKERGNRSTRRKPLGAEKRTNKLNTHITPNLGIEPRPHWWEASALTTAPSLHPNDADNDCELASDGIKPTLIMRIKMLTVIILQGLAEVTENTATQGQGS